MSRLLLSALVVLGVGCAGTGAAGRPGAFQLGARDNEPLLLEGSDISGPSTSLTLTDDGVRGRYYGSPLELQWTDEASSSVLGGQRTRLELTPQADDARRLQGNFQGMPVDIELKGPWLKGRFGECRYDTEQTSEGFAGRRVCTGREREQVLVSYPEGLAQRSPREQMTLLTLALTSDAIRNPIHPHAPLLVRPRPSIIDRPTEPPPYRPNQGSAAGRSRNLSPQE
jgi:hypothetical protein